MSSFTKIEKELLNSFKNNKSFFYAVDSVCEKHCISITHSNSKLNLLFEVDDKQKGNMPYWLKQHNLGVEIIWSCVTLYWYLLEEKMIFDFDIKSEWASGHLGELHDADFEFILNDEEIPQKVSTEFRKIIFKDFFPTQKLDYFFKHNFKAKETARHNQMLIAAWIGISVSLITSTVSIILSTL